MRSSVRSSFLRFTSPLEGRVHWMYVDVIGKVTTGIGNLIDPVALALPLPWTRKTDGGRATEAQIRADFQAVTSDPTLPKKRYTACEPITQLRLSDADIDTLVLAKLDANEVQLKRAFPAWDQWPADAQLGVLSMAWALGAGFPAKWPNFTKAVLAGDWATAATHSKINEVGNAGVVPRNQADALLFTNAAAVVAQKLPPEDLHWPAAVAPAASGTPTGGGSTGTDSRSGAAGDGTTTPTGDTSGASDPVGQVSDPVADEQPTEPGDQTSDPGDQPSDLGGETSTSADQPTDPDPEEQSTDPGDETSDPAPSTSDPESTDQTPESTDQTSDQGEETSDQGEETSDPGEQTSDQGEDTSNSGGQTSEPEDETTEPADETTEPADESTDPSDESTDPADESTGPADESTGPADESTDPAGETTEPADESSTDDGSPVDPQDAADDPSTDTADQSVSDDSGAADDTTH